MDTYQVTIKGTQPLLMHADNIDWADQMDSWKSDTDNKGKSKAGDDRTPAFRWIGCLYLDSKQVVMPTENLARCLMEGGAQVPVGTGKKTFKSQTQSGIHMQSVSWPFLVNGNVVERDWIDALMREKDFEKHQEAAVAHGFALFKKRAKIGASKHIRVRPKFDVWQTTGTLSVSDESITEKTLKEILRIAGLYKGLGDWRPGCKTPGPFGMFTAEVEKI